MHTSSAAGEKDQLTVSVYVDGEPQTLHGTGNGPIAAFVEAHQRRARVRRPGARLPEHALSSGGDAIAAAYVECAVGDQVLWGVGLDPNIVTASLKAVVSAVNRGLIAAAARSRFVRVSGRMRVRHDALAAAAGRVVFGRP